MIRRKPRQLAKTHLYVCSFYSTLLIYYGMVVTICTTCINIQKLEILTKYYIYVLLMILRINSHHFSKCL
jgi:hypothetical protein